VSDSNFFSNPLPNGVLSGYQTGMTVERCVFSGNQKDLALHLPTLILFQVNNYVFADGLPDSNFTGSSNTVRSGATPIPIEQSGAGCVARSTCARSTRVASAARTATSSDRFSPSGAPAASSAWQLTAAFGVTHPRKRTAGFAALQSAPLAVSRDSGRTERREGTARFFAGPSGVLSPSIPVATRPPSLMSASGAAAVAGSAVGLGIGIGVGVAVLAIVAIAAVLLARSKRKGAALPSDDTPRQSLDFVADTFYGDSTLVTDSGTVTGEGRMDSGRALFASFPVSDQDGFGIDHPLI
jgi:hypothetical protein